MIYLPLPQLRRASSEVQPSPQLLASAGRNGYVRLWDVTADQLIGASLLAGPGSELGVERAAFSPTARCWQSRASRTHT